MNLILLRHPKINAAQGLCYGRTDCLPDEATFTTAVDSASTALKTRLVGQKAHWYSSPLLRCANFSTVLAKDVSGVTPMLSAHLMEMNFGAWENLAWECIDRVQLDAWAQDPWYFKPGGVESVSALLARWQTFKRGLEPWSNDEVGVVVTHAGIIKMGLLDANIISEQDMWTYNVPYATPINLTL